MLPSDTPHKKPRATPLKTLVKAMTVDGYLPRVTRRPDGSLIIDQIPIGAADVVADPVMDAIRGA